MHKDFFRLLPTILCTFCLVGCEALDSASLTDAQEAGTTTAPTTGTTDDSGSGDEAADTTAGSNNETEVNDDNTGTTETAPANVVGAWSLSGSSPNNLPNTLLLGQTGETVSGSWRIVNQTASGPVSGTISGNSITMQINRTDLSQVVTLTGSATSTQMGGNWSDGSGSGTWQAGR